MGLVVCEYTSVVLCIYGYSRFYGLTAVPSLRRTGLQ